MTQTIKLPQLVWYDPRDLEISLPDGWHVEVCNMAGYNRPEIKDDQIKTAITNPIGAPRIRELAKCKHDVVMIFDDTHRPNKPARIVPYVLGELAEAGIPDNKIRFIGATGNHGAMNRMDFAKKLGEKTLARFPVYNHNPFESCSYIGTTSHGTKVMINEEVMKCDLKIALGATMPHMLVVFSGGPKNILPGVASIETTFANHTLKITDKTNYATNELRLDMEEAAVLAGLDVLIEGIVNQWGKTVALFAGAPVPTHDTAVKEAMSHYIMPKAEDKDIVIANTYLKVTESITGLANAVSLHKDGGDLVLIANSPQGQVVHYMMGPWGETIVGSRFRFRAAIPPNINHLIIYTEYPDLAGLGFLEESDRIMMMDNWDDVVRTLREFHGDKATVAVYPNGDIPYFG
ncbi:lactate racemase domain-containing protein [Chloroflexota bacterium]